MSLRSTLRAAPASPSVSLRSAPTIKPIYGHQEAAKKATTPPTKGDMPLMESKDISVATKAEYEHMVLITSLKSPIMAIAQLYRDRADVEPERSGDSQPQAARRESEAKQNCSGELKNQWGWGGFVTQDVARSQTTARLVALIYNWWSLFVGLIEPEKHAEAITSRADSTTAELGGTIFGQAQEGCGAVDPRRHLAANFKPSFRALPA